VRDGHTFDKLMMQATLVCCWFNPVYWLVRNELHLVHEFIADQKSVAEHDAGTLAELILQAAYPGQYARLTNPFFHHAIKRRLFMLTRLQNTRARYLGRLLALPLLAGIGLLFALRSTAQNAAPDIAPARDKVLTVVIDAGHGHLPNGEWDGAREGSTYESQLTLAVAQKINTLNHDRTIRIVLTRPTDENIDLHRRAEIAKESGADLFLSLHMDAETGKTNAKSGFQLVLSRDSRRFEESRALGSLLQPLLNNVFPTQKELSSRKSGIWVLDQSPCPAVLLEMGYITTARDREFVSSEKGQEQIAQAILKALYVYRLQKPAKVADVAPTSTPRVANAPADVLPAVAPADNIENIDINADRSITVIHANGKIDTITAAEAHQRGVINPADQIARLAPLSSLNPPGSLETPNDLLPLLPLKSGDTLDRELLRLLPLENILCPEGNEMVSCRYRVELPGKDIFEGNLQQGKVPLAVRTNLVRAAANSKIIIESRVVHDKEGKEKKLPPLVYHIR
jgi:N-acetylmuramoyl-L-alanine amidase